MYSDGAVSRTPRSRTLRCHVFGGVCGIIFPFWHAKSWESDSLIFGKMWIAQRKRKPYTEKYVYMFVRGPGWVQKKRGVENVIWHSSFDNFSPHMSKENNWNEAKLNKNMCKKIKVKWKYKQSKGENNKGKQSGCKKTKVNSKVYILRKDY